MTTLNFQVFSTLSSSNELKKVNSDLLRMNSEAKKLKIMDILNIT